MSRTCIVSGADKLITSHTVATEYGEVQGDGKQNAERILVVPENVGVGEGEEEYCSEETEDLAYDCHGGSRGSSEFWNLRNSVKRLDDGKMRYDEAD